MPSVTVADLIEQTREYMDAVGSTRWTDPFIKTILAQVYDEEWSNILNAAPYYTFQQLNVTTDVNGQIPFSALNTGSGDAQRNFYRILSVSDGNVLYDETQFQYVPLATTTNYLPTYPRLYYLVGESVQILPVATGTALYIAVNYKPTALNDLSSDTVAITFPDNNQGIITASAAAKLLLKGGAEVGAANNFRALANEERQSMLDDLRRRTINPTRMGYPDQKYDWSGG
jgi:hypothetical protein